MLITRETLFLLVLTEFKKKLAPRELTIKKSCMTTAASELIDELTELSALPSKKEK